MALNFSLVKGWEEVPGRRIDAVCEGGEKVPPKHLTKFTVFHKNSLLSRETIPFQMSSRSLQCAAM